MGEKLLIIKLFEIIGLTVDKDNTIRDQDTRELIIYRGNSLTIEQFVPQENKDLAMDLFKYFLYKMSIFANLHCLLFFCEYNQENDKLRIVANTTTGTICSNYYNNHSLAYIDLILTIGGINSNNLSVIDQ